MSIQDIQNAKILRAYCEKLGRKGVAERIIEIAQEVIKKEDAYQSTLRAAGMIRALAIGCKFDSYWDEKQYIGYRNMIEEAEYGHKKIKP